MFVTTTRLVASDADAGVVTGDPIAQGMITSVVPRSTKARRNNEILAAIASALQDLLCISVMVLP